MVDGSNDGKDFGKKAVDTLVGKLGSKDDDFTLFVAGYTEPMKQFIASNKGLKRRIKVFEDMYDFTTDELGKILDINLKNQNLSIDADAKKFLLEAIAKERDSDPDNFGNAGIVVDLVQSLPNYVDERLAREAEEGLDTLDLESLTKRFESFSAKDLCGITLEDVKGALFARTMTEQTKKNELSADNDDDTWQPKIGFHAGLGASAMIAPSTADRNRAMRAKAAKL